MAYANNLPELVINILRWFNIACLLITVLVSIDIFILPRAIHHEKVISRKDILVTTKSRYSSKSHTTHLDNIILTTENFRYSYYRKTPFNSRDTDSVRLVTTRLFKIVETGFIKLAGEEKELTPGTGIFGYLNFIPIMFALIAIFGVAMRHNREQLLNAAVVNIIIIIIQLWVLDYISF